MASPAALKALADALKAEQERRRAMLGAKGDPREWLLAKLDEMSQRMRAAPGWVEPTEEQRRQGLAEIEGWLYERGYMQN